MKILKPLLLVFIALYSTNLKAQYFARGADIGWLSEMEASGRVWRDSLGIQKDLLDILPDYCINSIRLRVWVDPQDGWSGKDDVLYLAKRAADKGYRIMIDFHYSDSWADPGKQYKPAAWENYSAEEIENAVYTHTIDVLNALKTEGVTPEWVQVGNETNNGMIWPEGRASSNMLNYARFVDSGYEAVKDVFPNTDVIVHVSNGYDNGLFRWNIGGLIDNGARFDIIAMSMYPDDSRPWPQYAQETLSNMQDMVQRYNKPIMVSEIGLATNQENEAKAFVEQVIQNLQSLPNNYGLGIFWWEPQAYNWKGYGKVAWNGSSGPNQYQATNAMKGFKYQCAVAEPKLVEVIFRVNMLSNDVSNGVYITGDMTTVEGNWQIIPMNAIENGNYEYSFTMNSGSSGAYYFLNADDWSARETVPDECVEYFGVDRGYSISETDTVINATWSSCDNGVITSSIFKSKPTSTKVYPNPFANNFSVYSAERKNYTLYNPYGEVIKKGVLESKLIMGESLIPGTYIIKMYSEDNAEVIKLIKK